MFVAATTVTLVHVALLVQKVHEALCAERLSGSDDVREQAQIYEAAAHASRKIAHGALELAHECVQQLLPNM